MNLRNIDLAGALDRHWLRGALAFWLVVAIWFVVTRWASIHWLILGDTDDNMRYMQVRALLDGQGWYDLRQYRLDPPAGIDIHWSRIVDLPLAGLMLVLKPIVGGYWGERLACGIAPLLPLAVTMAGLALTIRRLVSPLAWPLALLILLGCTATITMYAPMRVDHHGWQLAMLALTVAGLCDPRGARGGATVGIASAVSLAIGLEMLPYCAMAGAIVALRWVWDGAEARRVQAYGLTLAGGVALGYSAFASYANTAMRCDALTPVWLSVMLAAGALLFVLTLLPVPSRLLRLAAAGAAGAALVVGFAGLFPQCLARPEGVSDELYRTWLANVREARPIYRHPIRAAVPIAVLPAIGLVGALVAAWRARRSDAAVGWAAIALFTTFSAAMLLWQVRAGPAAQLLSVPGAVALAWVVVPWFLANDRAWVRVLGSVFAFLLISGLFVGFLVRFLPTGDKPNERKFQATVQNANAQCGRITMLQRLNRVPPATMFTHVDLGPRLIATTHHNGITGPYHRNEGPILDVHHAFTGAPEQFRAISARHHARYLLICPDLSETTVYRARNRNGFYAQLARGKVPGWLAPVALPAGTPFRLWRIRYDAAPDTAARVSPAPAPR